MANLLSSVDKTPCILWSGGTDGCTYIHVFNIHLCLLLQLDNNVSVEPLELQKKKRKCTHTQLKFIAPCIMLHARCSKRNVQLRNVTIRVA